jgi:hypothetical protein
MIFQASLTSEPGALKIQKPPIILKLQGAERAGGDARLSARQERVTAAVTHRIGSSTARVQLLRARIDA